MKKIFVFTIIFALVLTACGDGTTPDNGNGGNNENNTTLKIKNESFIEITDVIWNNVSFTNSQNGNSIKIGTNVENNVDSGSGYIYFKKKGHPIVIRTTELVTVGADEHHEFVFTNNMLVVEVSNTANNDTLVTFYTKPWILVKQSDATVDQYGEYNFGSILLGDTKDITFTIENIGGANLNIFTVDGKRINLEDNTEEHFSIIQQPLSASVPVGNSISFTIRFNPKSVENNSYASVHIKTNSQSYDEYAFSIKGNGRTYIIGDKGPGGGTIFFVQGGQYKECSGELGIYTWTDAVSTAQNYQGGGFTNWKLPDRGELDLLYRSKTVLGGFLNARYWSSTEYLYDWAWNLDFSNGMDTYWTKISSCYVRVVRTFSL